MPRTGRLTSSPAARRSTLPCAVASAASARIRLPSRRMLLTPSRCPSPSTSGPPDEPRGRAAVCSMAPWMRRPRGPRNERLADETVPKVTRSPRPPGLARANTGVPMPAASGSPQSRAGASPVSTSITARSLSASAPATRPRSRRPSAKRTVVSSLRRLWALVRTRPSATTTPEPTPQPRPMPTTEGPTRSAMPPMVEESSSRTADMCTDSLVTCNLQATLPSGVKSFLQDPGSGVAKKT